MFTGVIYRLYVGYMFVFIVLAYLCQTTNAQPCAFPSFESGRLFPTGKYPFALAKGDVNNDGKLDVVSVNNAGNSLSLLRGTGDGGFFPKIDSTAIESPTDLVLGHLDEDGKLDAVVIGRGTSEHKVAAYRGGGDGTFSIIESQVIENPLTLRLADVNADLKLDIVVIAGDYAQGRIVTYLGNGNGTFNSPITSVLPSGASYTLVTGDFDTDGDVDIIYSTVSSVLSTTGITVMNGDRSGSFSFGWNTTQNYGQLYPGKFNQDEFLDFAVANTVFDRVTVYNGNGNGTFTRVGNFPIGGVAFQGEAVDVNKDGMDDLITSSSLSKEMSVLVARGDGSFYPVVNYTNSGESEGIATGDFNTDGNVDVVAARSFDDSQGNFFDGQIRLTFGRGNGEFIAPINYPLFKDAFPRGIAVADINGDGKQDVITANMGAFGISVFPRIGAFKFSARHDLLPNNPIYNLIVRDVDQSGTPDIIGVGGTQVYILKNIGNGTFGEPITFTTANFPVAVASEDFNRDGKLDLVVGSRDWFRFTVYFGNGDGTFSGGTEYGVGLEPVFDVDIADFNGDAKPDLAVIYDTGIALDSKMWIYLNQGNGAFLAGEKYSFGMSIHPNAAAVGDINNDGKQDVVVSIDYDPSAPANVRKYLGNGNGTFTYVGLNGINVYHPEDVILRDFNLDGKLDLATANNTFEDASILEGLGNGAFALREQPSTGKQALRLAAGHLNRDSSPDIVVANYIGSSFTIIPNECNRSDESGKSAPFDFDGDGKSDISVWRPSDGVWYIIQSGSSSVRAQGWGLNGDKLAPADFDGDGKTDLAVFRESDSNWYIFNSSTNTASVAGWGLPGDLPVPADYGGDGKADLAVYRPNEGKWYRRDSDGKLHIYEWGLPGDKPAPADFNGDGVADMTVFRPSEGKWYILNSGNASISEFTWGLNGDVPVPGDYSGDGKSDFAVFRPSNQTWYRIHSDTFQIHIITWGLPGDFPTPGDYDGDGRSDLAVFRPSNSTWFINSSTGGIYSQPFGLAGDIPVENAFVY